MFGEGVAGIQQQAACFIFVVGLGGGAILSLVRCRGPRIALTLMVVGAGFDKVFQGFEDKVAER